MCIRKCWHDISYQFHNIMENALFVKRKPRESTCFSALLRGWLLFGDERVDMVTDIVGDASFQRIRTVQVVECIVKVLKGVLLMSLDVRTEIFFINLGVQLEFGQVFQVDAVLINKVE